jgi:hypothetical protein
MGTGIVLVENSNGHKNTKAFTIFSMVLVFPFLFSSIHGLFCTKKIYDGEPFIKIVKIVWELSWILLAINIGLQLDGFVRWTWKKVFYPTWIAFAILITASLVSVGVMMVSLVPTICCRGNYLSRFLVSLWINLHLVAGAVLLVLTTSSIIDFLEDITSVDKRGNLITLLVVITIYTLVLLISAVVSLKSLM